MPESPQRRYGFLVLLLSFFALAFSLAATRDRLAQDQRQEPAPVASDSSTEQL